MGREHQLRRVGRLRRGGRDEGARLRKPSRAAVALAAALVLAACTADQVERGPVARQRSSESPPAGGTATFGFVGAPHTLDPYARGAGEVTWAIAGALWPSLYTLAADGSARPALAAALRATTGGAEVDLAPATWRDGTEITVGDVVASARRARPPSGFAGLQAEAVDADTVLFEGRARDWALRLARLTFVLPDGASGSARYGGPFQVTAFHAGLGLDLARNPRFFGPPARLDGLKIRFVADLPTALDLLGRSRLDAAQLPSSTNLPARLESGGLEHDRALGWETLRLRFGDELSVPERRGLARLVDRRQLGSVFVRGDGRVADTLFAGPGPDGAAGPFAGLHGPGTLPAEPVAIVAFEGDELALLLQRALFEALTRAGVDAETLRVASGTPAAPALGVALVRSSGAPGLPERERLAALREFPLFQVSTVIAHRPELRGPQANPTLQGPLWNAGQWSFQTDG